MRKAFFLLLPVFLFILTVTSCSSDNDGPNVVLLSKVTGVSLGQQSVHTFSYNGTKLTKVAFEIEAQTDGSGYDKYFYTGDLITQIKRFNALNQNTTTTVFTYDVNKRITQDVKVEPSLNYGFRTVYAYNSDGSVTATGFSGTVDAQNTISDTSEKFYFQNGEVSQKDFFSNSFSSSVIYSYDTANHPMRNVTGLDAIKLYAFIANGLFGYEHNMIQQNTYLTSGVMDSQVAFTINYNSNNYPVEMFSTMGSNGSYQYSFQYFK